jgi:hypothetical protein
MTDDPRRSQLADRLSEVIEAFAPLNEDDAHDTITATLILFALADAMAGVIGDSNDPGAIVGTLRPELDNMLTSKIVRGTVRDTDMPDLTGMALADLMSTEEYGRVSVATIEAITPALGRVLKSLPAKELYHAMATIMLSFAAWLAERSGYCGRGDPIKEGRFVEMAEDAWTDRPPQGGDLPVFH